MIKISLIVSIFGIICIFSAYGADDASSLTGQIANESAIVVGQIHSSMDSESLSTGEALVQIGANPIPTAASIDMGSSLGAMHETIDSRTLSVGDMLMQVNANLKKPSRSFFHNFM